MRRTRRNRKRHFFDYFIINFPIFFSWLEQRDLVTLVTQRRGGKSSLGGRWQLAGRFSLQFPLPPSYRHRKLPKLNLRECLLSPFFLIYLGSKRSSFINKIYYKNYSPSLFFFISSERTGRTGEFQRVPRREKITDLSDSEKKNNNIILNS